jgi:hypothetical protein
MIEKLMLFESGEMEFEEVVKFFQELVDSGTVWKLQGYYGRFAEHLIHEGLVFHYN